MSDEPWRPPCPEEPMPTDPVEILAWHIHWTTHRRAICQCAAPDEDDYDHAGRTWSSLTAAGAWFVDPATREAGSRVVAEIDRLLGTDGSHLFQ